VVERNGGVVDKFIGDAIMALFPQEADDALQCAVEFASALKDFNARRTGDGRMSIRTGIGIHSGMASIGAIGTQSRLETTVIGDSVNLAARLEATTREYGAQIVVSESVLYALNRPEVFQNRFLDRLRVKGKMRPVSIYEIFSPDNDAACAHKATSRTEFERAVAYYHTLHVEQAREIFVGLCASCPEDRPAQVYLDRCDEYGRTGRHYGTGEISRVVAWSHDYDIGVSEIDEQHQEWCKRLARLFEVLQQERMDELPVLFDYLRSYIEWHFGKEEAVMDRFDYPLRRQHKLEHLRYADALQRFAAELKEGSHDPLLVTFRANLFLVDWFVNHTTGTDRQLGHFLAQHGAA
jgi:hemerythrin